jgi:mRNA-degrading endonuclease toxin of MazEF toxin-antitoxin module
MCDQIRNFDKKKRLIRKVGVMPEKIIKEVEKKLQELIINYD